MTVQLNDIYPLFFKEHPSRSTSKQCFRKRLKLSGFWQKDVVSFLEGVCKPWGDRRAALAFNVTQFIIASGFRFGTLAPLRLHACAGVCRRGCFSNRRGIPRQRFWFSCALLPWPKPRGVGWHHVAGPWHTRRSFSLIAFDNFCVVWDSKK